jgi:multidrug efflux pump subunit AcrA (membrane-fusion protein)
MISRLALIASLVIICFTSCNFHQKSDFETYVVIKKSFENAITVSGTIESNKVVTVQCPGLQSDLTITGIIAEGEYVHKGDTVCYLQCTEIENDFREAVKNLDLAKSELEKLKATNEMAVELLESQIKNIQSQTSISELDTVSYQYYSPMKLKIARLELQKAYIQKEKIEKKRSFLERMAEADIHKQELKIQKEETNVQKAKETLLKLKLVSRADGYVQYVDYLWSTGAKPKLGDKVWWTMPILKIADMSSIHVKLLVNESHFRRIEKDQKVNIVLDAYPDYKLTGKITIKSPTGKAVKENSKVKTFEVLASIDSNTYKIQPGVSVSCNVCISSQKNVCLVPITSVFDYDSLKVVYVLANNGDIKRRKVKTGMSSDKEVIIENGIKPNEAILLSEPTDKQIQ